MNGWPVTRFQLTQFSNGCRGIVLFVIMVFVIGNIINGIVKDTVVVNPSHYVMKEGFPLFTSEDAYIKLVLRYPHDFGTRVRVHTMRPGETFWEVARANNLTIDTIIAANPFLQSLEAREGLKLVLPGENGVLMPVDDMTDVWRMKRLLTDNSGVSGEYLHGIFDLFARDDMRFVFFKGSTPLIVNKYVQRLYDIRRNYQAPVLGYFTSMFGMRTFDHFGAMEFHNGVDISARSGTPIRPVREGIVSYTGWREGYGRTIIIQHRDGYISMYGHLLRINVRKGESVNKNRIIGELGSTGRSTGPHLHFAMSRHGRYINPLLFIW